MLFFIFSLTAQPFTVTASIALVEDQCITGTASLAGVGSQEWVPIYSPNNRLMAEVLISNNDLETVVVEMFRMSNTVTAINGLPVLGKQIAIHFEDENGVEIQPNTNPVYVRLYYTEQEASALINSTQGSSVNTFSVVKTNDACGTPYSGTNALEMNTSVNSTGCTNGDYYFEFFTATFSSFFLFPSSAILPVKFEEFTVKVENKDHALLAWTTSQEVNNSHFEIEHSIDGRTFNRINDVAGVGNSHEAQAYQFLHKEPAPGLNYYRLKQVDFDGQFAYSSIEKVQLEDKSEGWTVYPNPTTDGMIYFKNWSGGDVFITDVHGSLLKQQRLGEGEPLSLNNLPAGIYFLQAGEQSARIRVSD